MMRIAPWRIALTGGAVLVLGITGVGLALAASPAPSSLAPAASSSAPVASPPATAPGLRMLRGRIGWRALVHAEITLDRPAKGLVTVDLDHGTIVAIGDGSISIAEAGGSTVTVATDGSTRVRVDGKAATLADLHAGDQVYVVSRLVSDGSPSVAAIVVVPRAQPASGTNGGQSSNS